MRIYGAHIDPKIYSPDNSAWLTKNLRISDISDHNTRVAFGNFENPRHDTVELSGIRHSERLIEEGQIKTLETGSCFIISTKNGTTYQLKTSTNLGRTDYSENGLDNYFLTQSPGFIKYWATGYANYLNPEVPTDRNSQYSYYDYDEKFTSSLKAVAYDYSKQALKFFEGEADDEAIDKLTDQFATLIKELGTQMAAGKGESTASLKTKLTINGVDMTLDELKLTTQAMKTINESTDFLADHISFGQLGLGVAQMNYFAKNYLSDEVGKMVMYAYNKRLENDISEHDTCLERNKELSKAMWSSIVEKFGIKRPELSLNGKEVYCNPYYRLDTKYQEGAKKDIFNWFACIDGANKSTFKDGFDNAIAKFNDFYYTWAEQRGYGVSQYETQNNYSLINKTYNEFFKYF